VSVCYDIIIDLYTHFIEHLTKQRKASRKKKWKKNAKEPENKNMAILDDLEIQSYLSDNTTEVYDESLFGLPSDYEEEEDAPSSDAVSKLNRPKMVVTPDMAKMVTSPYDGHYARFQNSRISSAWSGSRNTDSPETVFTEDYRQTPDSAAARGRLIAQGV